MINYLTGENMKKIGIIAEYNPFHNGHIYHLSKIKELYPDSIIILALNGYFLERGDISVLNKEDKTKLALKYGVDVVIELPTLFGTQSADQFAFGSIFLLNALGVEEIVFGSETTDLERFYQLAKTQLDSDFSLKNTNKKDNYPTRLNSKLNVTTTILPNDILAISYIKTILKYNYNIKATAIKRTNNYHDLLSDDNIISASNIRNKKQNNQDISSYLPIDAINKWQKIDDKKLFSFLKYKILLEDNLDKIIDVTEGLDYKLKKEITKCNTFEELVNSLKSKRYTYNRLKRMLIHIFLNHQKKDSILKPSYIHILGFSLKGKKYLNINRKNFLLPTKVDKESLFYQEEIKAALLYDMLTNSNSAKFDLCNKPIFYNGIGSKESSQK